MLKFHISPNYTANAFVVGDSVVGKTSFIKCFQTGKFEENYTPTTSVQVSQIQFYTLKGGILFSVWDTAGEKSFECLKEDFCQEVNGAPLSCLTLLQYQHKKSFRNGTKS